MNLQESILKSYKDSFGHQTLAAMSTHTGLNISRLFRILNGAKMRLEEYEVFKTKIQEKKSHIGTDLEGLFLMLDDQEAKSFQINIERKMKKKNILLG